MVLRLFTLLASVLVGGALGIWSGAAWHFDNARLIGVVLGVLLWFAVDAARIGRFQRWLSAESPDRNGPQSGLWGDLTTRVQRLLRERERAVAESRARLQDFLSALQVSPNGVVLLDRDARIEWCNSTAASHFGLDAQRDMLQTIGNLVRDPGFVRYLSSRDYTGRLLMPGRDSTVSRPVVLSIQLHPYGLGRMLLLSSDITALEQAEAMRRDFVANVSHEIRTPLTVLAGFIETLQTLDLEESEREHYLALMEQQAGRMQTLVNDLLMLSRLEGSPPPDLEVKTPAAQLMRQLREDALALSQVIGGRDAPAHVFTFAFDYDGPMAGTPGELLSAMGNLVSNAIRYTPAGGHITVSLSQLPDATLQFSVTDTGPGVAPEHIGRLTERFYRVDRSRSRETGGTGLGLAIVKHVAQRHGAQLSIDSTPGKGSTFRLGFAPPRSGIQLP